MHKEFLINIDRGSSSPRASEQLIKAILVEISVALQNLAEYQQPSTIDLRGVFHPQQTSVLKNLLGKGEVYTKLTLDTLTEIEETAIKGVWWITHYDVNNEKNCELIEIVLVPELLMSAQEDIQDSIEKIKMLSKYHH